MLRRPTMAILVGCSGWSYDDWIGRFYPLDLAGKKGEWFSYYKEYFQTVEINSSFYRPPGERQVSSWIKKAGGGEGFEFSVKVPQLVTHRALVEGDLEMAVFWAASFEKSCVKPLSDAGLLGAVLLQLSPYFHRDRMALQLLADLLDGISPGKYSYAVEFRHHSWLNDRRKRSEDSVREALQERNVAEVMIDGPGATAGSEDADPTADHAYFRLHGRNCDIWYKGDEERGEDHRLNRYDYLYRAEQLDDWVPRIKRAELKAAQVRVYFNNHARAKAVRNAFQLMDMLSIEHKCKEIHLQDQFTLGEF